MITLVLGLSAYFTYANDWFGVITKFENVFKKQIKENDVKIEKLEKELEELNKENNELRKEINSVNKAIDNKFVEVYNSNIKFEGIKKDIVDSGYDTQSNIDYLNAKYR